MSDLPYPPDRGGTHSAECYRRPHHHNCAVMEVDRLRAALESIGSTRHAGGGCADNFGPCRHGSAMCSVAGMANAALRGRVP